MVNITDLIKAGSGILAPEIQIALQAENALLPVLKKYAPLALAYVGGATGALGRAVNAPAKKKRAKRKVNKRSRSRR